MKTIRKHYDALGSYLHMQTLKQQIEDSPVDFGRMRQRCETIFKALEEILASRIWNVNLGIFSEIECVRCQSKVRKRIPSNKDASYATCFECRGTYQLINEPENKVRWQPLRQKILCCVDACAKDFFVWECDMKEGATVKCPSCNSTHYMWLQVSLQSGE